MTKVDRPLLEVIDHYRAQVPKSYRKMVDGILAAGLAEEFADLILSHIPLDEELVIVEGYGLHGEVLSRLEERLHDVAYVWQVSRLEPAHDQLAALVEEKAVLQSQLEQSALDADRAKLAADRAKAALEQTTTALNSTIEERDLAIRRLERLKQRRSVRAALRAAEWMGPLLGRGPRAGGK
jgi:hypothetical protein